MGQSVTLVCTAHQADDFVDEIRFSRYGNITCGRIHQSRSGCSALGNASNYLVSCGPGSSSQTSRVKKYMLKIQGMKAVDFTEWWCHAKSHRYTGNSIQLKEKSKYHFNQVRAFSSTSIHDMS